MRLNTFVSKKYFLAFNYVNTYYIMNSYIFMIVSIVVRSCVASGMKQSLILNFCIDSKFFSVIMVAL